MHAVGKFFNNNKHTALVGLQSRSPWETIVSEFTLSTLIIGLNLV